jgi:oxygen-independent coproporphyrinogen III oxidase
LIPVKVPAAGRPQTAAMVTTIPAGAVEFDLELLARYDVAGPRYTSYPTAPSFRDEFGEREYRDCLRETNQEPIPRPLSLYVHIPFCESPCFYCGCTRLITRDHSHAARYLDRLQYEIALQGALFDGDRTAVQLHLGGGTPNFLDPDELSRLVRSLGAGFRLEKDDDERDFSIEIDPRCQDPRSIAHLAEIGFNRVSFGVQDFDPVVQRAINRIQPVAQTRACVEASREAGIRSVNLDLIYGLPKQRASTFARTLETVVSLRPERIALYAYAHLPQRFKAQRQIESGDLPRPAVKLALLGMAIEAFTDAGYRYIGMDHFALPSDRLARALDAGTLHRSFQGYSTHGECDLVGLGMSAISHVGGCFAQNARTLPAYYQALLRGRLPIVRGLTLDEDDRVRGEVIQAVMCRNRIDFEPIERQFGIRFWDYFEREYEPVRRLARDGLVEFDPCGIAVTPRGRLLLRVIAMAFDSSFRRAEGAAAGFSRVI